MKVINAVDRVAYGGGYPGVLSESLLCQGLQVKKESAVQRDDG